MTVKIKILVLALLIGVTGLNAQSFQGVATYKTKRDIDVELDSTNSAMNDDMHKKIMEMMKKQFQKTYLLTFNKEVSIYKQEEELDKPQVGGVGIEIMTMGGGSDILYKNTKTNTYVDQKDTMGKIFLVKDTIESIKWKLEQDTKYIGEYQCYKATYIKKVPVMRNISFGSNSTKKDVEKALENEKPELEDRVVTAWYTPQIPVNNGPVMYQGLPGLILEIHDGKLTIVCSKIVLNPKEKIEISQPTKGKEVNQKKYEEIMEKKSKEMMERFRPNRGDRDGESISITIGG